MLGCHEDTVVYFLNKLRRDQGILWDCGFVERIETGRNRKAIRYFCRMCGDTYREPMPAGHHAFRHVFPDGGWLIVQSRDWLDKHPESPLARYG